MPKCCDAVSEIATVIIFQKYKAYLLQVPMLLIWKQCVASFFSVEAQVIFLLTSKNCPNSSLISSSTKAFQISSQFILMNFWFEPRCKGKVPMGTGVIVIYWPFLVKLKTNMTCYTVTGEWITTSSLTTVTRHKLRWMQKNCAFLTVHCPSSFSLRNVQGFETHLMIDEDFAVFPLPPCRNIIMYIYKNKLSTCNWHFIKGNLKCLLLFLSFFWYNRWKYILLIFPWLSNHLNKPSFLHVVNGNSRSRTCQKGQFRYKKNPLMPYLRPTASCHSLFTLHIAVYLPFDSNIPRFVMNHWCFCTSWRVQQALIGRRRVD